MNLELEINENESALNIEGMKNLKVAAVDINDVRDNPINNEIYGDRPIDDLEETIKKELYTPIIVVRNDDGKTYRIISGHRRTKAIRNIFELGESIKYMGREYMSKVPVLIHPGFESEEEEKRAIITANVQRIKTTEERQKEVSQLYKYYSKLKDDGLLEKGDRNIVKHIADDIKLGETRTKKLLNDIPEYKNKKRSLVTKNDNADNSNSKDNYYQDIITELNRIEKYLTKLDLQKIGNTEKYNIKNKLSRIANIIYEK